MHAILILAMMTWCLTEHRLKETPSSVRDAIRVSHRIDEVWLVENKKRMLKEVDEKIHYAASNRFKECSITIYDLTGYASEERKKRVQTMVLSELKRNGFTSLRWDMDGKVIWVTITE